MIINSDGSTNEDTDWQLSSVYVWNSHLPDDVFAQVSADLNAQLAGTVGAACAECPAGRFSVDSTRLNCVSCPAGKYKDIAGAQWSFRIDESPWGWQEAYDEAAAAGRRLPTLAELRAYMKSNPSAFTQFDGLNRWTPVVNPGQTNSNEWLQIGTGHPDYQEPRGITHYERWGSQPNAATTDFWPQVYTEVFDACTDCPAGKISAAIGASSSGACASCAAGKYSDAVVVVTNPRRRRGRTRRYQERAACSTTNRGSTGRFAGPLEVPLCLSICRLISEAASGFTAS